MAGVPAAVDARPSERRVSGSVLGWGVLALLVVLLAFELVTLIGADRGGPSASAADVDVARRFAVAATSFDYKRLDADVRRVLDLGSPRLERDFRSAMGPNFTNGIATNKSVSTGVIVVGPRVQTISVGRAIFLVVVDQTVTSEGSPAQPRLVHTGLLVTVLEKTHQVVTFQIL